MMMLPEVGVARKSRSRLIDNHSGAALKAFVPAFFRQQRAGAEPLPRLPV
jgi:hypothetical protein